MTINTLMIILYVIGGIMLVLLVILAIVYFKTRSVESSEKIIENSNTNKKSTKSKQYSIKSVFDFMDFDKIEDNMIIQKNGRKYLMVIECQGINYDLMSEQEKVAVEEGFIQFLNILTDQIQIYIQTRTINLASSIQNYEQQVSNIEIAYNKEKIKYNQLVNNGNATDDEIKKAYYELVKQQNLYEYGKDIISNTKKMSLNKNILTKKYYVVLSYYPEDSTDKYDKEEIKDIAFSELYVKCQSIIRALNISGVTGKILTSTQLVELLYVAYNRDDAEIYDVGKATDAKYDELYSTAPDYMDKKIKLLDEEINKKAYELANAKVVEAQNSKIYEEKEKHMNDIIADLAKFIIEGNANIIGRETADKAKEEITNEKRKRGRKANVQEEKGSNRNRA